MHNEVRLVFALVVFYTFFACLHVLFLILEVRHEEGFVYSIPPILLRPVP